MECKVETVKEAIRACTVVPFFTGPLLIVTKKHRHHHQLFPQPLKLWLYESENEIFFNL